MQMIPAVPYRTPSKAEKKIFDLLRTAMPDSNFTAYHSLNLTRHAYKRFGEIDFLLCGSQGLFVVEVKGGRVNRDGRGNWVYTKASGRSNESREGPFRQAESALHGLVSTLKSKFPNLVVSKFAIGYGVVLPDCELPNSSEWDPLTVADARKIQGFNRWLNSLVKYWRKKNKWASTVDAKSLREVKRFLRPIFEAVTPLYILSQQVEEELVQLTEDQLKLVDIVTANERVLCSGGAGTGKTFLAMEIARRWSSEKKEVLLVCHSLWLKNYLESRFTIPNLTVSTVKSLQTTVSRLGKDHFSALIADEGQDLFNWNDIETLDKYLEGGLNSGQWCFFYDANNQADLFGKMDNDVLDLIIQYKPSKVPLTTNCRNTNVILEKIKQSLGADMGIGGAGAGPDVREHFAKSVEESTSILEKEIKELVNEEGIPTGSVTVLSPLSFEQSSVSLLPKSILNNIVVLDEFSLRDFPPQKTSFAEIAAFKGLENEAIVVVDLASIKKDHAKLALHYVGMSRARAILSMIFIDDE